MKTKPQKPKQEVVRTYFQEVQLLCTPRNLKGNHLVALEINRLIHAAICQGATYVDLQWDGKKKWFTVFARRNRPYQP